MTFFIKYTSTTKGSARIQRRFSVWLNRTSLQEVTLLLLKSSFEHITESRPVKWDLCLHSLSKADTSKNGPMFFFFFCLFLSFKLQRIWLMWAIDDKHWTLIYSVKKMLRRKCLLKSHCRKPLINARWTQLDILQAASKVNWLESVLPNMFFCDKQCDWGIMPSRKGQI